MEVLSNFNLRFRSIRNKTVEICQPLAKEDFVVQPIVDVSPPKWHLGHTTWFFENFILAVHKNGYRRYNEDFNFVFNSYYENVGARVLRTDRGNLSRPSVEEVFSYRHYVDAALEDFLESLNALSPELTDLLEIGLQHEQQHQELLVTDLKYILGNNPLFPPYLKNLELNGQFYDHENEEKYLEFEGGIYPIGASEEGFKFDNELGRHKVFLQPFRILDRLINNHEYLEFIEAGGYQNFKFWLSEGWEWLKQNAVKGPLYWHKIDQQWFYYTLSGLQKINPNEPVTHISYYEADAFASWKSKRLLTEFEWETASKVLQPHIPDDGNFLNSGRYHPQSRKFGDNQLFGDVWEWTQSSYLPYPYYAKDDGALGEYNGKFMINQMVLKGGSCATMKEHIRHSYRNFFHPDKQWQFTGIRLAEHI